MPSGRHQRSLQVYTADYDPGVAYSVSTASNSSVNTEDGKGTPRPSRVASTKNWVDTRSTFCFHERSVHSKWESVDCLLQTLREGNHAGAVADYTPLLVPDLYEWPDLPFIGGMFHGHLSGAGLTSSSTTETPGQYDTQNQHKSIVRSYGTHVLPLKFRYEKMRVNSLDDVKFRRRLKHGTVKQRHFPNDKSRRKEDLKRGMLSDVETCITSGILSANDTSMELKEFACEILRFWPEGVIYYTTCTSGSNESAPSSEQTHSTSSNIESQNPGQAPHRGEKPSRTGRKDGSGEELLLSRGFVQNANAEIVVVEWRCIIEAGKGDKDESCAKHHFQDKYERMLRHMLEDHAQDVPHGLLQRCRARLKIFLKLSSDEGCETHAASLFQMLFPNKEIPSLRFDCNPKGERQYHRPPIPLPRELTRLPNDHTEASPSSGTITFTASTSDCSASAEANLATKLSRNPDFALEMSRVLHSVSIAKRKHDAELIRRRHETESYYKEISQSYDTEPLKRRRMKEVADEQDAQAHAIEATYASQIDQAKLRCKELSDKYQ